MTPEEMKYLQIQFQHLDKQNMEILIYLASIMTPEQHRKVKDYLKGINTRPDLDMEKIKKMFAKQ